MSQNEERRIPEQYDPVETDVPESPTNLDYQPEWKRLKTEYDDCVENEDNNHYQEEYFFENPQTQR